MAKNVIAVWKPIGWTPLRCVLELCKRDEKYRGVKVSYAGRLDPMADGIILLLIGDENKKRKSYEDLEKTYHVEVLFGVATDTYDALGMPISFPRSDPPSLIEIKRVLQQQLGIIKQQYPPYSSKPVGGKPLFWWARQGRLNDIVIPEKNVTIYSAIVSKFQFVAREVLFEEIATKIEGVEGDFRQKQILEKWKELLRGEKKPFLKVTLVVRCSSGTYMRGLAHTLGELLGCGAIAHSITRIGVGPFSKKDCIEIG